MGQGGVRSGRGRAPITHGLCLHFLSLRVLRKAILRRQTALESPLLLALRAPKLPHRRRMEPGYSLSLLQGEGRAKGGAGSRVRGLPALP